MLVSSLVLIRKNGIVGVAVATVVVYWIEKVILMFYNYFKYKIKPQDYTPIKTYLLYSIVLIAIFILIDQRIIMLPRR